MQYEQCCGRFLDQKILPSTALELMKSRYTAYVLKRFDYLRATWHPDSCPDDLEESAEEKIKWLGLNIKNHTSINQNEATVEFIARYKIAGNAAQRIHEISYFQLSNNHFWRYVKKIN